MAIADDAETINAAVVAVYEAVQSARVADAEGGLVPKHEVPRVSLTDMPFSSVSSVELLDTGTWAEGLRSDDPRFVALKEAQGLFARLAHVPPYNTRANDGWEAIVAIAIAAQRFDFVTGRDFSVEEIQRRVRVALQHDQMIERNIWALFGVRTNDVLPVGESAWIVPPTEDRCSYVAMAGQHTYPLIHAHCFLVVDRVASSEELRTAKRDPLPARLIKTLRAVCRPSLRAMGPWFETLIMLPSRFAGFRTRVEKPNLNLSYWVPNDDVDLTRAGVDEAVELNKLLETEVTKELKTPLRSLQLAINRLGQANARNDSADELLDLMIALEALLSKDGEKTEINYRIALRGALASSAKTMDGRIATQRMLKNVYNLRSEIVHGAKREAVISTVTLDEFQWFVSRMIRMSGLAISQGAHLVEQIEAALLGDATSLEATSAKLERA